MGKLVRKQCIVCALSPVLFPGRLLGITPIIATCPHQDNTSTSQTFKKDNAQKYLGAIWVLAMTATLLGYTWMAFNTPGVVQFKLMSEMFNSLNSGTVIICAFKHVDMLLLELNGLSSIVEVNQLLTEDAVKYVRILSMFTMVNCYAIFAVPLASLLGNRFELDFHNVLYLTGVFAGGMCCSTIYSQSWAKMFLMRELHKESFARIQTALSEFAGRHIEKTLRLHMAIVRNYKECNRYWSPGIVCSTAFACVVLIAGFYTIAMNSSVDLLNSDIRVASQTIFLTAGITMIYSTQEYLQNVVSANPGSR